MDYSKLGLKVGLEIHQQLASDTKLFCKCPITKEDSFPLSVSRRLRPAAGELEIVDPAALFEFLKGKEFIYKYNQNSSCLIELDEKPPDPINEKALRIATQAALLLNCKLVDEAHVMRKNVVDGSNVSGFQRTALIATNGSIKTSFGDVGIQTVSIEEDASTPLSRKEGYIEYRLDRQGIPLIEIATAADMHSPREVREAAEHIGTLLRSLPVVRGIGSIRQDVNISIERGARIEIKGFQELGAMEKMVENEVKRQVALIDISDELNKKGIHEVRTEPRNVTDLFRGTKSSLIRKIVDADGSVIAIHLKNMAGFFKKQVGDRSLGKEIASYVEPFGLHGIIHSDENVSKYNLNQEFTQLRKKFRADQNDLIIILAGHESLEKAAAALLERINHLPSGVPEETRVADGSGSRYTRPLPGSGRLYPETDLESIKITDELKKTKTPKTLHEKQKELKKELPKEMAEQMIHSDYLEQYEEFRNFGPTAVADTFLSTFTDLRRKGMEVDRVTQDDMFKIFSALQKKEINKSSLPEIFEEIAQGEDTEKAILMYAVLPEAEIRKIVKEVSKKAERKEKIFGLVMQSLRGRADADLVRKIVEEETKP